FSRLFSGGVYVAVGDFNGDGFADVVAAADAGGGPQVRAVDGRTLTVNRTAATLASFYAYSHLFTGGVRVAVGDVNGDHGPDLIPGPGPGGGPDVRIFNGAALNTANPNSDMINEYYAFKPTFTGGVFVAAGDANGDGRADVLVGTGANHPLTDIRL